MSTDTPAPQPASLPTPAPVRTSIAVLALRPVLLFATFGLIHLLSSPDRLMVNLVVWQSVLIVAVDLITIVVVARLLHRQGRRVRDLVAFRRSDWGWAPLASVIIVVGFFAGNFAANLITYAGPPPLPSGGGTVPLWLGVWASTVMPVTIGVAEELGYRGFAQGELTARSNKWVGLLVMAVFFGVQHLALTAFEPQAWLARFLTTFFAGLMFGLLYWWFKRLAPIIVGHVVLDVLGLGLPLLTLALAS